MANDPHEMTNRAGDPAFARERRELIRRIWEFAAAEDDMIFNPYGTVALMPYGPAIALGDMR